MAEESALWPAAAVGGAVAPRRPISVRLALFWTAAAAVAGGLLGAAVGALSGQGVEWWFVQQSAVTVEVIVVSALVASRYAFPAMAPLPRLVRYILVLLALAGGAFAATALSIVLRWGALFTRPTTLLIQFAANVVLALVVGGALIAWDSLQLRLERTVAELRKRESIEREMRLAQEVQRELLPHQPEPPPGFEISFDCRPAGMVGGDLVDFVPLPGGRLGIGVGDVMGKGVAAALLMASVQSLMRAWAPVESDPARLNAILSSSIADRSRSGRYVTFAYVILEPATGALRYSLAGHQPPLIAGPDGIRALGRGGLPLGLDATVPYESGEERLRPGEVLVLYTDGLVEAPSRNGDGQEFGREGLIEVLLAHKRRPANDLLDRILAAMTDYTGDAPLGDDTTVIVARHVGLPASGHLETGDGPA